MKTIKILLVVVLIMLFGIGCYVIGGIRTGLRVAVDSDTATLMWITEINRLIRLGKPEKADKLCFVAAMAHLDLLEPYDMSQYDMESLVYNNCQLLLLW